MHIRRASGLEVIVICSLLTGFVSFPALAQVDPPKPKDVLLARELLSMCAQEVTQRECLQYIKGVRSGLFAQQLFSFMNSKRRKIDTPSEIKALILEPLICVPDSEPDEEVRDRVVAEVKRMQPEELDASAGFLVLLALVKNYRCKDASPLEPGR